MKRWTAACLAAALACTAPLASAQMGTRAYAPENLSQLSGNDRARVISQEYADQSNGRRIPDDQLRFYLDQVNSGWGFSRIKQDIATSLRGNGGGSGWNGGNGGWNGPGERGTVRCESNDRRERSCPTGWRNARLVRQISGTQCVEGRTWGMRNGSIWVNGGCRAEFAEARGHGWGGGNAGNNGYSVTCSSNDRRRQTCGWERRQGRPVLIEQLSGTACVEGRNWGYDGNAVWVSGGCRARFGAR